jgi:monomeric sarcosine oxidase
VSISAEYIVVGLGALGSATAYALAGNGHSVLGLERFELGHSRGASHDTSRILRHSYHTPGYVRLTCDAYDDWAQLEADSGEQLVTPVGGLDLFPPDAAIPPGDYTGSMAAVGVDFDVLAADDIVERWPAFVVPDGTVGIYQRRGSIVPAARGTSTLQRMARRHGAALHDRTPVTSVRDLGAAGVEVEAGDSTYRCRRLVVCADAWTNDVLAGLDWSIPLTVTLEQVTYFAPDTPDPFMPGRLPLWIWMDDPSYYGFPCYGEATLKAAEDCGGPVVTGDGRPFTPDPARVARLADFMARVLPGSGRPVRSLTCLYTLTPDRDFVLGPVPGHESVLVGLGAAHGFKFAPTLGRMLAELATTGKTSSDLTPFRPDRSALLDADAPVSLARVT